MIFITFVSFLNHDAMPDLINEKENQYDVRAAEEAKINMQGVFLSDRKIDVHYSLPKEEEERARCDKTKNQVQCFSQILIYFGC